MTVYRTDIERALAELISNEEGMRFQGIALSLAKQKWPALIASQRKKDLGMDGFIPTFLSTDGVATAIASSLTATFEKVESDIARAQENEPDIRRLIFYTPLPVTNETIDKWRRKLGRGVELTVVPREDLILDLLQPQNEHLCRSHLNLAVTTVLARPESVLAACTEVAEGWARHPRLQGRPRMSLRAIQTDRNEGDPTGALDLPAIQALLAQGGKLILEAPAGRGKTTTLVQVAQSFLATGVAFLVDLPSFAQTPQSLFEYIAQLPPFLSRRLSPSDLAQVAAASRCTFLINGWNEVSDRFSEAAVQKLRSLERDFPQAGLLVATRPHRITPPLSSARRTTLLPLSPEQRRDYLNAALTPELASELCEKLESNRELDDISKTPLIVAEVARIFEIDRDIPPTSERVLKRVILLVEQAAEHRDHLQRKPLSGHASDYLEELAVQMTSSGSARLNEALARRVVHSVGQRLAAEGQLAVVPEPSEIIAGLCAHHLLERTESPPSVCFEHQQFQEVFAAQRIQRTLRAATAGAREEALLREYLNAPAWEDSLLLVASEIETLADDQLEPDATNMGARLVALALEIDPVLAANLARLCGKRVWSTVRADIGGKLRDWYSSVGQAHSECALAAMLATGSHDFADVLIPLLSSEHQQIRLRAYRHRAFHLSSLGTDWREEVRHWGEHQRADFVSEVVQSAWSAAVAEELATEDPSSLVRATALNTLEWVGALRARDRALTKTTGKELRELLPHLRLEKIPQSLRPQIEAAYRHLFASATKTDERLYLFLECRRLGLSTAITAAEMQAYLVDAPRDSGADFLLKKTLEVLALADPTWTSQWLIKRVLDGSLWLDDFFGLISSVPEEQQLTMLRRMATNVLRNARSVTAVLSAAANESLVSQAVHLMRALLIEGSAEQRNVANQLLSFLRAVPLETAVPGVLSSLSPNPTAQDCHLIAELFGWAESDDGMETGPFTGAVRDQLRKFIIEWHPQLLAEPDLTGQLKAYAGRLLGRVGGVDDVHILQSLIFADLDRRKRGKAARHTAPQSEAAQASVNSWSHWYVEALRQLDPEGIDSHLLALLSEPDYEREAAAALLPRETGLRRNYKAINETRRGRRQQDPRMAQIGSAIEQRLGAVESASADQPHLVTGRLKVLAVALAASGTGDPNRVLEILGRDGHWDGYLRLEGAEALLRSGATLDADATIRLLEPAIEQALQEESSRSLLDGCLSLLAFVEPAPTGLARIEAIKDVQHLAPFDLRETIRALGYSRAEGAIELLSSLAKDFGGGLRFVESEWIEALTVHGGEKANDLLLGFVNPRLAEDGLHNSVRFDHYKPLSEAIVGLARGEARVRNDLFALTSTHLSTTNSSLLADVLTSMGTEDSFLAALNLISNGPDPVPQALFRDLEELFVERRAEGDGVHSLHPRNAAQIKRRLFAMVAEDPVRRVGAWLLLGHIENWRLTFGRPSDEPRHPALESGLSWPPIAIGKGLVRPRPTH